MNACLRVALMLGALAATACTVGGTRGNGGGDARSGGGQGSDERWLGRPAPEIVVERMDGKNLSLSSLRGSVVLLDVWASWCIPCKQELPMLDAIADRLRDRGVEVLAVSIDQDRENVQKFLRSRPLPSVTVAHDPGGAIADTFQPEKMPTSYIIDRHGTVRHVNSGFEPADAKVIERRLADLAGDGGGGARPGRKKRN
jgi:thiol-disulfide isomerase/thioredoxin